MAIIKLSEENLYCSFCGKSTSTVKKMVVKIPLADKETVIVGGQEVGVFYSGATAICSECIGLCVKTITDDDGKETKLKHR